MNQFTITTELVNKVLAYLGTRPYAESSELITDIQGEYQAQLPTPTEGVTGSVYEASSAIDRSFNIPVETSNQAQIRNAKKKPKNIE